MRVEGHGLPFAAPRPRRGLPKKPIDPAAAQARASDATRSRGGRGGGGEVPWRGSRSRGEGDEDARRSASETPPDPAASWSSGLGVRRTATHGGRPSIEGGGGGRVGMEQRRWRRRKPGPRTKRCARSIRAPVAPALNVYPLHRRHGGRRSPSRSPSNGHDSPTSARPRGRPDPLDQLVSAPRRGTNHHRTTGRPGTPDVKGVPPARALPQVGPPRWWRGGVILTLTAMPARAAMPLVGEGQMANPAPAPPGAHRPVGRTTDPLILSPARADGDGARRTFAAPLRTASSRGPGRRRPQRGGDRRLGRRVRSTPR